MAFCFSFLAAAFAAAICCRRAAEPEFAGLETARFETVCDVSFASCFDFVIEPLSRAAPAWTAGPNASDRAGRGFDDLPATVLLPVILPGTMPFPQEVGTCLFDGDGERGAGAGGSG